MRTLQIVCFFICIISVNSWPDGAPCIHAAFESMNPLEAVEHQGGLQVKSIHFRIHFLFSWLLHLSQLMWNRRVIGSISLWNVIIYCVILISFFNFSDATRKYDENQIQGIRNSTFCLRGFKCGKSVRYRFYRLLSARHEIVQVERFRADHSTVYIFIQSYRVGQFLRLDDNGSWQQQCFKRKDSVTHSHDEMKEQMKLWWKSDREDSATIQFV